MAQEGPTQERDSANDGAYARFLTVGALSAQDVLTEGDFAETTGFHNPGDGGGALYRIQKAGGGTTANGADVVSAGTGLVAVLAEREAVNYAMFGAVSDGENDDGAQIKLAHEYANRTRVPVVNTTGEFWLKQTNSIPIVTNVSWGHTIFHINERHNGRRRARFIVQNDEPTARVDLESEIKRVLLEKVRPGVQIIPELAPYAGHLVRMVDRNDRIGIRAGERYSKRGWAREELFYVEEEGRIIGDIAWGFTDLTSITATPCNRNYLVVEGGGFHVSGDTPVSERRGYHKVGIDVRRSRTIVREQWVGLEKGRRDNSLEPRSGFYSLSSVYDVTLENIRLMPWEKNREGRDRDVQHGTYGISGGRMLHCTFRNLTAEAGHVAWGVFGTNVNKNFRLESCRLNRVDVHFHCWNLYIRDCTIGFKGITVTGGGDLVIENTVRHGSSFIGFRSDYGSKWDGHIRIRGCTFRPTSRRWVSVLAFRPRDFDYKYQVGYGRSIEISDMVIDFGGRPESEAMCWLVSVSRFSKTEAGSRLLFPQQLTFRNITVEGRAQGVRILRVPDPYGFDLRSEGGYDGDALQANCSLVCENVQLEKLTVGGREDQRDQERQEGREGRRRRERRVDDVHLQIGGEAAGDYADALALYPMIRFTDCEGVCLGLRNCVASAVFERCSVNTVQAPGLRGELMFDSCRFRPNVLQAAGAFNNVESSLGTRFRDCTVHAPVVNGKPDPDLVDRIGFLEINGRVQHYHTNTAIGNAVVTHLRQKGTELEAGFIASLRAHHALDT